MPRIAAVLNSAQVRDLSYEGSGKNPVSVAVGEVSGLNLQISPSGARSWILRITVAGRRREMGLGAFPEVGLEGARDAARLAKAAVRDGRDPMKEREDAKATLLAERAKELTFSQAVDGWMSIHTSNNKKNRKLIRNRMRTYAESQIGARQVSSITVDQIEALLKPIWDKKTATATRLREDIARVFKWAKGNGRMDGPNPAVWAGNLEYRLKSPLKRRQNRPAVQIDDAPRFMCEVAKRGGNGSRALEFLILTAARSGEVRGATWSEIDLKRANWVIPASRMKMSNEHRVPLSDAALALLRRMPNNNRLIFPANRGGTLSDMTLSKAMVRIHEGDKQGFVDSRSGKVCVPHGWRSCFRSWAAENGYSRELAETALAHKVGNAVEQTYQRSDMIERRRAMMEAWARHVTGLTANIVESQNDVSLPS